MNSALKRNKLTKKDTSKSWQKYYKWQYMMNKVIDNSKKIA